MARRGGTATFKCNHDGCAERAHYDYSSRADYERLARQKAANPWLCMRHLNPGDVLGTDNPTTTKVLTVVPGGGYSADKLFWHNGERLGSGFVHGDGYKAYAQDFPPGTRLIITTTIELPEETP